jgi:hypothetical protein
MLRGIGERPLQPETNNRAQARSNVFLAAALVVGTAAVPVRLRNLSTRGALLDGASLPPAGARVRLLRGELSADGEIAWQSRGQAGLRFDSDIDVDQWVRRVGHPGQQRVDVVAAAYRCQEMPPAKEDPGEPPSLATISSELDAICERIAASPAMTVEIGEELVRLDALARCLLQLAAAAQP